MNLFQYIWFLIFGDGEDKPKPKLQVPCIHGHLDWSDCPDCGH